MNRRLTLAIAAVAAIGLGGALVPTAGAAVKKNRILIVGGGKFKAGKFAKDDVRYKPLSRSVKSGATVKVINKGTDPAPHTISFVQKRFLPKGFEFPAGGPLLAAHGASEESEDIAFFQVDNGVGVPNETAGVLEVNQLGKDTFAGDSQFIAPGQGTSFKVTASKGQTLPFYCAIHPWMQSKLTVK